MRSMKRHEGIYPRAYLTAASSQWAPPTVHLRPDESGVLPLPSSCAFMLFMVSFLLAFGFPGVLGARVPERWR